jgi:hypothetical protein
MGGWYSMMNKEAPNKIKIPWYNRNVKFDAGDDMGINNPVSFNLPNLKTRTRQRTQPQEEPVTQPAMEPAPFPAMQQNPLQNPLQLPNPFPQLFPLPNNPLNPQNPATAPSPAPAPAHKSPAEQMIGNILKPILLLFAAREVSNNYVKVTVTDPIYSKMLQDPVLGTVLREGEKANLDAAQLGTILANFDWQNGDYKSLEKTLAVSIGVAGAARLIVFIIGRKVIFRM